MHAPQIILISLIGVSLLLESYLHGKPRSGNYNIFEKIISYMIEIGLLCWGGFFG